MSFVRSGHALTLSCGAERHFGSVLCYMDVVAEMASS